MNANVHDDDYCRPRACPFALLWATQRMPEIIFLFGIFGQIKSLRSWPQIICITRHRTSIYLLLSSRVLLLFALSITNSDEFIFTISHQIPGCCASGRRYWLLRAFILCTEFQFCGFLMPEFDFIVLFGAFRRFLWQYIYGHIIDGL